MKSVCGSSSGPKTASNFGLCGLVGVRLGPGPVYGYLDFQIVILGGNNSRTRAVGLRGLPARGREEGGVGGRDPLAS